MIIKTNDYTPTFLIEPEENDVTIFNNLVKLDRGNLICIAARPGMGKTSLVLHMALEYAKKCDKTIYIFSSDLCSMEIYERMICSLAEIDTYHMRIRSFSAEDKDKIKKASTLLKINNSSISEIALFVGLDPQNFSRFFKRATGKTPKQYIKENALK